MIDKFVQKPALGEPPAIEWKALSELQIDTTYQRSLETPLSERLIRNMASAWDWRLCAPLTVSDRGEAGLFVIDGQHRLEAARLRSDIDSLPCIISRFESVQDEARLFVEANTLVRKATPLDKFHARVVAGDEEAVEINRLVESAGLIMGKSPYKIQERELTCVQSLARSLKQYGSKILSAALVNMAEAWPSRIPTAQELLPGICLLLHKPPPNFDPDLFVEMLGSQPDSTWYAEGVWAYRNCTDGWPDEVYRDIFLDAYLGAARKKAAA